MLRKIFDVMKKRGLRTIFGTARTTPYVNKQNGEILTSYKIHHALAKRLERRGMIREAIQIYIQAANMYPPKGYESLKIAAELAQKFSLNEEAAKLWFESIYYSRDVASKMKSLIKFLRESLRTLINAH